MIVKDVGYRIIDLGVLYLSIGACEELGRETCCFETRVAARTEKVLRFASSDGPCNGVSTV